MQAELDRIRLDFAEAKGLAKWLSGENPFPLASLL